MTATRSNWRVKVKRGDVLSVSATYDSKRASWYESMGIMPVAFAPGARGGVDPFSGKLERRGRLTHGHLRGEQQPRRRGGRAAGRAHAARRPGGDRRPARDHRLPLRPGRPAARRRRLAPARRRAGAVAELPQHRRRAHDLPHDHRLPRALQPLDRDRLPARRRARRLRLRRARLRPRGLHPGGQPRHLGDALEPRPRHLHVLLPRPPVHARGVPGQGLSRGRAGGVVFRHGRNPHTHAPAAAGGARTRSVAASSPST